MGLKRNPSVTNIVIVSLWELAEVEGALQVTSLKTGCSFHPHQAFASFCELDLASALINLYTGRAASINFIWSVLLYLGTHSHKKL